MIKIPTCPACKHKHRVWNPDKLRWEHIDTEEFIELPIDHLYACPKCGCVLSIPY